MLNISIIVDCRYVICFFLFTLINNQKTSLHRFPWANVLSQLAVV
jgi:hypothetical protein